MQIGRMGPYVGWCTVASNAGFAVKSGNVLGRAGFGSRIAAGDTPPGARDMEAIRTDLLEVVGRRHERRRGGTMRAGTAIMVILGWCVGRAIGGRHLFSMCVQRGSDVVLGRGRLGTRGRNRQYRADRQQHAYGYDAKHCHGLYLVIPEHRSLTRIRPQILTTRSLSALPTTLTELSAMAAAAMIGDSRMPRAG